MPQKGESHMNKWRPSPSELVHRFDTLLVSLPGAERRKMFGYPCAFTNGQMFTGLHQENMILRLGDADRADFLRLAGAGPFEPLPGRPMREYVVVPGSLLDEPDTLRSWLERSFHYASSLPPKERKKARG
jgi:TfoX/Sxy family transcriptional regulator of competence genes